MHSHDHDLDGSAILRPKVDRIDSKDAGLMYQSRVIRRTDVLGVAGLLGLQRAVGNAKVSALFSHEEVSSAIQRKGWTGGERADEEPTAQGIFVQRQKSGASPDEEAQAEKSIAQKSISGSASLEPCTRTEGQEYHFQPFQLARSSYDDGAGGTAAPLNIAGSTVAQTPISQSSLQTKYAASTSHESQKSEINAADQVFGKSNDTCCESCTVGANCESIPTVQFAQISDRNMVQTRKAAPTSTSACETIGLVLRQATVSPGTPGGPDPCRTQLDAILEKMRN